MLAIANALDGCERDEPARLAGTYRLCRTWQRGG